MTVNQLIKRVREITLAHKQIRTFRKGLLSDFFSDKTAKYPAACLQDMGGSISLSAHASTFRYRLFLMDLVHVSSETKENEDDVLSDLVSVAMDLLAQLNYGGFNDWKVSADNNIDFIVEAENDMPAGVVIDFSVSIMYEQNVCQVPTDILNYTPTDDGMKYIYDAKYTATGTEGTTLTIPELVGKKIIFMTRGNAIIYKTSSAPTSSEFTWDDTDIGLGAATNPNEPFLILYRNY